MFLLLLLDKLSVIIIVYYCGVFSERMFEFSQLHSYESIFWDGFSADYIDRAIRSFHFGLGGYKENRLFSIKLVFIFYFYPKESLPFSDYENIMCCAQMTFRQEFGQSTSFRIHIRCKAFGICGLWTNEMDGVTFTPTKG